MIAQTVVEYGALQTIAASFMKALHRTELFLSSGNSRYLLFLGLALIAALLWTRRRSNR